MSFAEAFNKAAKENTEFAESMEEQEAKELGVSLEVFQMWKMGFEQTYAVVTERVN